MKSTAQIENKTSVTCKVLGHEWVTTMSSDDGQEVYQQCKRCRARRADFEHTFIPKFMRYQEKDVQPDSSFVDVAICFPDVPPDIDDYIETWHDSASEDTVSKYLGMTEKEYFEWVDSPDALPKILFRYAKKKYLPEDPLTEKEILIAFGKYVAGYRPGEELWSLKDQQAYDAAMQPQS